MRLYDTMLNLQLRDKHKAIGLLRLRLSVMVCLSLCVASLVHAGVDDYLKTIRTNPKALYAFFKAMPKGGELHYHFDGSSPPETMLEVATHGNYCLNPSSQTFKHYKHVCHGITIQDLLHNKSRYDQTIEAWSMKKFVPTGHQSRLDHFFAVFAKEGLIQSDFDTALLAHIIERASSQHELYLEMIAFHLNNDEKYASLINSAKTLSDKKRILFADPNFQNSIQQTIHDSQRLIKESHDILGCKATPLKKACLLTVKFQYFVNREAPLNQVFAQALAGFAAAAQSKHIVGVNLVSAENGPISLRDYTAQMQLFQWLHTVFPNVHIALHAGELTPHIVTNDQLRFHIHDAVFTGHAERIGHGVDITHEKNLSTLVKYMANKPVVVEINLTSNRKLLDVYGKEHPINYYLQHHVPIILSTDDEGILRTDLTYQFVDAFTTHQLNYATIKNINRNALTYSFLPGASLWENANHHTPVAACQSMSSVACQRFIKENTKARLQWTLEMQLKQFESRFKLTTL